MRHVLALAVAMTLIGGLTACTHQEQKRLRREWKDAAGKYFDRVDINSASRKELNDVPGISGADADRIIANRPYGAVRGLVRKNVLPQDQFERVRDYLTVD